MVSLYAYLRVLLDKLSLGLPSKARGKYQKRKLLTEEQKAKILRARNRDNARRTRKRKKLYVNFIDKALKALETALGVSTSSSVTAKIDDDGRSEYDNEDAYGENDSCKTKSGINSCFETQESNADSDTAIKADNSISLGAVDTAAPCEIYPSSSSTPSVGLSEQIRGLQHNLYITDALDAEERFDVLLPCPQPTQFAESNRLADRTKIKPLSGSCEFLAGRSNRSLLAKRLRYMKAFLKLRHCSPSDMSIKCSDEDVTKKLTEWLTVCAAEVVHVTPLPAYRNMKDLEQIASCPPDCKYECRGVDAVSMDSQRIAEYFDTLVGTHNKNNSNNNSNSSSNSNNNSNINSNKDGVVFTSSEADRDQSNISHDNTSELDHRSWIASFAIDYDQATLSTEENALNMTYVLTVQVADKPSTPSFHSSSSSSQGADIADIQHYVAHPSSAAAATAAGTGLTGVRAVAGTGLTAVAAETTGTGLKAVIVSSDSSPNTTPAEACSEPMLGLLYGTSSTHVDDNICSGNSGNGSGSGSGSREDDDDICRWLEMALDTAYLHQPSYQKRDTQVITGDRDGEERDGGVHSVTESSLEESDLDSAELSHCYGSRIKRRRYSASPCDDIVCHTADAVTAGEVLFRLKVKAHVEFGDSGSDSDGRILRIVEYFTESCGSYNFTAPVC
jgi:hypothetical protein